MTWPAALSGAPLRVLRTAAGRRALQVGLLVGGLFLLGFLCGEQAHAADGVGAVPGQVIGQLQQRTTGHAEHAQRDIHTTAAPTPAPAPDSAPAETPTGDHVLRPVTDAVVGAVDEQVLKPVGDAVETVTSGLTETVGLPSLPALPELPTFPESPSWPTLPEVPVVPAPELPGLPGVPGQTLPAPVTPAPQPPQGGHAATKPADGAEADAVVTGPAVYGPRFAGQDTGSRAAAHSSGDRGTSVHLPARQAPGDVPGGALGSRPAVDNGTSRHGDAFAVTFVHRAPLRLLPGAAACVDAAGTRDRHRDIPVFPG
ncbi:hypothetical protein ABZ896_48580 [Streptomyces sp. NPDC047072]|uniref:hypothetical protein n=1 Tax=Streptomyces sp. NPDC047072 TaxID=3154809 RepID=UPI0033F923FA